MPAVEEKLKAMGLELPEPPTPMAHYVTARRSGKYLYFSGAGPFLGGKPAVFGKVGRELTLEEGYRAARLTGLNLISQIKNEVGDLDKVRILKVLAFVASDPEFIQQPDVMDGVSDLFVEVFGEKGLHARSAVATPQLPFNIPIEVEVIVEVER